MKTLAIVSHPYASQSRIINALQQTAEGTDNVIVAIWKRCTATT
jgi:hypothetical protein